MNTIVKSFSGAVAGTLLVLLTFYFMIKPEENDKTSNGIFHQTVLTDSDFAPGGNTSGMPSKTPAVVPPAGQVDFTEAAAKSVDAVVHIKNEMHVKSSYYDDFFSPFRHYFYPNQQNSIIAFGSGVIISPDGYIVTNNHVVDGADKITVTFNDKTEKVARIIGTDPSTDLALIKVDGENFHYLEYGNSDELKVGEWVLAVGNPFNLTSTVTAGIVSAKARNINILGGPSAIESFIQTDAVVNRGNSGGALVNAQGKLVGINAAIASHTGVYEGYSFAIPVNIVKKVVEDLKNYGATQRAYLGVQVRDIDEHFAKLAGIDDLSGIYVSGVVNGGGADEAGIIEGNIILAVNNKPVNSLSELTGIIGQYRPGDKVVLKIKNENNEEEYVKVTLKDRNNRTELIKAPESFFNEDLGAWFVPANDDELAEVGLSKGLKITELDDGILKRGGLTKNFIIYDINGNSVYSENSLKSAIDMNKRNVVKLKGVYPDGVKISFEFIL